MFGRDDGIYIKVVGPARLADGRYRVQVTSSDDPEHSAYIRLSEEQHGIYRNGSNPLRLDAASADSLRTVLVLQEPLLTFTLQESTGQGYHSVAGVDPYQVEVDYGEVGAEYQTRFFERTSENEAYMAADEARDGDGPMDDLPQMLSHAWGLCLNTRKTLGWRVAFLNPELHARQEHWIQPVGSGGAELADTADIASLHTHGRHLICNRLVTWPLESIEYSEVRWGEDLEWVFLGGCSSLIGDEPDLLDAFDGVHLICGYGDTHAAPGILGQRLSEYLCDTAPDGSPLYTIARAWHSVIREVEQPHSTHVFRSVVCGDERCFADVLPITASVALRSADPAHVDPVKVDSEWHIGGKAPGQIP